MIDKLNCYDPRTMKYGLTDNPGLIFGWYAQRVLPVTTDDFWNKVKELAEYCDEVIFKADRLAAIQPRIEKSPSAKDKKK